MKVYSEVGRDGGFTLVELMVVVLIIGILVAIALPVFSTAKASSMRKTCFANQRTLESAAQIWSALNGSDMANAEGLVDGDHPFLGEYILRLPPLCPSAPAPDDPMVVTAADGAYSIDASGTVGSCAFGDPVHGYYR